MCEIEDLSLGHQDIYFNKYSDCFVSGTMDLYITDSLQDMLDMDIKSEMATDLGSGNDYLSDTLGVSFSDLPPLLDMEMDNATTWIAGSNSSLHNSSNFVHNLDLYGSEANAVMVNPNSVMPSIFSESPVKTIVNQNSSNLMLNSLHSRSVSSPPLPSPTQEKSHLTFSPNTIKVCKVKEEIEDSIASYGDLEPSSEGTNFVFIKRDNLEQIKKDLSEDMDMKPIKVNNPTVTSLRIKTSQPELVKLNRNTSILNSNQRLPGAQYVTQTLGQKTYISSSIQILGHQQSRTILTNGHKNPTTILIDNGAFNNNKQVLKTTISSAAFSDNNCSPKYVSGNKVALCSEFPKPAYSYSCLIAMALKNSRTGSLPVSEIYNFMCKHFPYFKTAPNGWKNSVRHNLSLNKCFEKIEKPSTNGGQRKGCLWAMNPSKVGKMDEEVQKWSRKDPQAIRKAMVRPDSLEALERGDMKYSNTEDTATAEEDCSDDDLDVDELLQPEDQTTDVEVMETTFDEIDIEESIPLKLEFSLASQFHHAESPAKRAKASFLYQTVNAAPAHANRRKTPLVNRIA